MKLIDPLDKLLLYVSPVAAKAVLLEFAVEGEPYENAVVRMATEIYRLRILLGIADDLNEKRSGAV